MIDTLLGLVPDYGLWLLFAVVALAGVAVPLPASMLVLTAGSFAAAGDLGFAAVVLTTLAAFVLGDQIAFLIARRFGRAALARVAGGPRLGPVIARSEALLDRHGAAAVFLRHTVLSPTCPYVSYLSGAGWLAWRRFTPVAVIGAALWALSYAGLGYAFASQLEQVATFLGNVLGFVLAAAAVGALALVLRARWRARDASNPA
ncbi:DedA family protein [Jannaschia sp. W003]|uniref:DedA family protein n=1 Tax=Jannaschia sp. W003 TaxID=2867012 RepID=UPI0021A48B0F|nr:VTT domain-containing protein [Jannaschia sp. W003]UWQ20139.1 VTT domain-containing protein [Jannaschia sp. W003]